MHLAEFGQSPVERCNRIGRFEQVQTDRIPPLLVLRQRGVGPGVDRAGERLRISQRVRDAMRGQRVLEVPGVSDEGPAGAVGPPEETGVTGEAPKMRAAGTSDLLREPGREL